MDDFNVLQVTTAQPKARATMRGAQGQKPRTKTKADRERPRRQEAERKKAEHEQELKDMLERQQTGMQPKQARKEQKSQLLQPEEIKQEVDDDADAGAELFPAQTSKPVAAKKTQNQNLPAARPMKSARSSRYPDSKALQGQDPALRYSDPGMGGPSRTLTSQPAEEIHKPAQNPTVVMQQAQPAKTPAAKKIRGLDRTPADRSSKLPAARGNQDQISDSPSAAMSNPANSLPSTGRSALKEDALRMFFRLSACSEDIEVLANIIAELLSSRLGSPRPYQTTDSWIMVSDIFPCMTCEVPSMVRMNSPPCNSLLLWWACQA